MSNSEDLWARPVQHQFVQHQQQPLMMPQPQVPRQPMTPAPQQFDRQQQQPLMMMPQPQFPRTPMMTRLVAPQVAPAQIPGSLSKSIPGTRSANLDDAFAAAGGGGQVGQVNDAASSADDFVGEVNALMALMDGSPSSSEHHPGQVQVEPDRNQVEDAQLCCICHDALIQEGIQKKKNGVQKRGV